MVILLMRSLRRLAADQQSLPALWQLRGLKEKRYPPPPSLYTGCPLSGLAHDVVNVAILNPYLITASRPLHSRVIYGTYECSPSEKPTPIPLILVLKNNPFSCKTRTFSL